jgi:MiaB/RimO family radical SAM methylthiotransferase
MIALKRILGLTEKLSPFALSRGIRQFQYISDERCYYLKISTGCLGRCSYCAVRRAKGRLLSRDPDRILHDFETGLKRGYTDFVLSADESGSYGRDRGFTLAGLLQRFLAHPGEYRIFLRNMDPRWLIEDLDNLIAVFRSGRFPYLVCPVQAGSPAVLERMDRGYTVEAAEEALTRLHREISRMILRTHFIVGFPGESDDDFDQLLTYARRLPVDHFKVHEFSARPHTRAALLPDPIPPQIIRSRAHRLRRLGMRRFASAMFRS